MGLLQPIVQRADNYAMAKSEFQKQRLFIFLFVAMLTACSADEPGETANGLRDLNGELAFADSQAPDTIPIRNEEPEAAELNQNAAASTSTSTSTSGDWGSG